MAPRRPYGGIIGSDMLAAFNAANSLTRQLDHLGGLTAITETHRRLLGSDLLTLVQPRWAERNSMMPGEAVLSAARHALQLPDIAGAAGLAHSFRPLAMSALELFERPAWQSALAQVDLVGEALQGGDLLARVAGLGATLDATLTLAGLADELAPALPKHVLGALEASYSGWAATVAGLPREPEMAALWRSRVAGEVPLRLSAAAVLVIDEDGEVDEFDELDVDESERLHLFDVESGVDLDSALGSLHASLPKRLRAAKDALLRDDDRAGSQAAHELVELVNHSIRLGASDDEVRQWLRAQPGSDPKTTVKVTTSLRLEYLASRSPAAEVARAQVDPLKTVLNFLQGVKHSLDVTPVAPVRLVVPAVEAALALLFGRCDE